MAIGLRAAGLAALAITSVALPVRADEPSAPAAIKADFLFRFAPFVDWPAQTFATAAAPFRICVIGEDPFGPLLDRAVQNQHVGTHPIAIARAASAVADMACNILFAGHATGQAVTETFRLAGGPHVLTVTDQSAGTTGGIIQFVERDGRVRFTIDNAAAAANGIQISSKLLELAVPAGS